MTRRVVVYHKGRPHINEDLLMSYSLDQKQVCYSMMIWLVVCTSLPKGKVSSGKVQIPPSLNKILIECVVMAGKLGQRSVIILARTYCSY